MADNQEPQKSWLQKVAEFPSRNLDSPPSFGGQMAAMGREAVKDVRDTVHQVFFGQAQHPSEPGTPLNPTPQMVTKDLDQAGTYSAYLDNVANRAGPSPEPEKDQGLSR